MKKINIYLILFFISTKIFSQQVDCTTFTFENGIKRDLNGQPYTGPCNTIDLIKKHRSIKGAFKNGLQEGKWEYYTEDGKIESRESYKNGKKDGAFEEYALDEQGSFTILSKKKFKEDKPEGAWELYNNGILYSVESYKDGEKNGEFREYDSKSGVLRTLRNLKTINGKTLENGIQVNYKTNNKNDTTTYKDGIKDGLFAYYHSNGQFQSREIWINGVISDGIYETFFADGSLGTRREYKGGKMNGVYEDYYKGKKYRWGLFKNGQKDGLWVEYEDDKLSKKRSGYYENDKKIKNM
jgi:antitoxin component YwqK of YwqJK toxin-antitoxin module